MDEPRIPQVLPPKGNEGSRVAEGEQPKSLFEMFIRFLEHEHGKEMAQQLGHLIGTIKEDQQQLHNVRVINTIARYVMVAGILALAGVLSWKGKLDTTITGLLSLTVGYILGRQRADEK